VKKVIALVFSLISATANAAGLTPQEIDGFCTIMAEITTNVATRHQQGVSLQTTLDALRSMVVPTLDTTKQAEFNEALQMTLREITLAIYESPRYRTEEMQQTSIAEWRDVIHVQCLRGMSPEKK
jgi:hypothetical protein